MDNTMFIDTFGIEHFSIIPWVSNLGNLYCSPVVDPNNLYFYQASSNGSIYKLCINNGWFMNVSGIASTSITTWISGLGVLMAAPILEYEHYHIYQSSINGNIYKIRLNDGYFIDKTGSASAVITPWINNIGELYSSPIYDSTNTYLYQASKTNQCIYKIKLSDGKFVDKSGTEFINTTPWINNIGNLYASPVFDLTETHIYQTS